MACGKLGGSPTDDITLVSICKLAFLDAVDRTVAGNNANSGHDPRLYSSAARPACRRRNGTVPCRTAGCGRHSCRSARYCECDRYRALRRSSARGGRGHRHLPACGVRHGRRNLPDRLARHGLCAAAANRLRQNGVRFWPQPRRTVRAKIGNATASRLRSRRRSLTDSHACQSLHPARQDGMRRDGRGANHSPYCGPGIDRIRALTL